MDTVIKKVLNEIDALARGEEYAEALRRVDELAKYCPSEPWIWRTRAYINSRQGNIEGAILDLSQAIAKRESEPDFFYTRGILFFEGGNYPEAVADFTRVIELCDYHKSDYYREGAYFFRADAHVRLQEFEKAKGDCQHVPDGTRIWTDSLRTKAEILAECH